MKANNSLQKNIITLLLPLFIIGSPFQSHAQDAPLFAVDLSLCSAVVQLSARLACFDDLAEKQAQATKQAPKEALVVVPASATSEKTKAATTSPSVSPNTSETNGEAIAIALALPEKATQEAETDIEQFGKATIETGENGNEEFIDQIVSIQEPTPNKKTITLTSGQIWRQMVAKRLYIRKGDMVRIKKIGSRKSYQLTVEDRSGFIQVERVQ